MTYGGPVPAITASYEGFVNGDSDSSLSTLPSCSTTATSSSPPGTYPSSCSGAEGANYDISYVDGTITVGQGSQTISFTAPASGLVGGQATLSATGGASGNPVVFSVDASSGAGVCNVSGTNGTTVKYTAPGSCVIDANQAGNTDYAAAPEVQQSFDITVGQGSQTISFTAPASGLVGGQATLSATGGASGNPVVFSVDASSGAGVCNVSGTNGTTVKYTAPGSCVIDANQAGNTDYAAAPQVQQSFDITVGQGSQTISFTAPASGLVGGQATLSATGGASGNPVVFSVDASSGAGVCNVSGTNGTTVKYTAPGSCVIDANQAGNTDYAAAPEVQQSFDITVGQGSQTISFTAPASGLVGGQATLSATGGASGNPVVFSVDASSGAGVCNVSGTNGTTVKYTAPGSCVIDANQAGNTDYAAAPQVQQSFDITVGQGSQTISFTAPASGLVGGQATLSATGGASGNPVVFSVDASSGAGVCNVSGTNGTTVKYTAPGSCVIDANQAGNTDYAAAPEVQQSFDITVGQGSQTISFTAPASGLVGGQATLSATGGASGNPVVFSSTPQAGPGSATCRAPTAPR